MRKISALLILNILLLSLFAIKASAIGDIKEDISEKLFQKMLPMKLLTIFSLALKTKTITGTRDTEKISKK